MNTPLTNDFDLADTANAIHALEQRASHFEQLATRQGATNQAQATELSELFSHAADIVEQLSRNKGTT